MLNETIKNLTKTIDFINRQQNKIEELKQELKNKCVVCGDIIPEGYQLCPKCFAVSEKPKTKILIEMDINAVPSEITARVMLRLIDNYCRQYGKRLTVKCDRLDFEDKNQPIEILPLTMKRKRGKRL